MGFRDEVLKVALEQSLEAKKHREESQAKKIKRWQAFRNAYELVALQLGDLNGLKLAPRTQQGQECRRELAIRRIEELPAEPLDSHRVYLIEIWVTSNLKPAYLHSGWLIHWRTWDNDNKVKRTYADDDPCWRSLNDDCLHRSATVLGETAKAFKYDLDLSELEGQHQRGLDL